MTRLFDRKVRLVITDVESGSERVIEDLQVEFSIRRTLEWETNKMGATVYNLNADTRKVLEDPRPQTVTLEAGYGVNLQLLFKGRIRVARSRREGPNIATDIEAHDGRGKDRVWARRRFGAGASLDSVFSYLIGLTGLGEGNLRDALTQAEANGLPRSIRQEMRVRGYGIDQLSQLSNSYGLQFSVQNEECLFLQWGEPITQLAPPQISSTTGLSGTPSVDNEGILNATFRLIPNVFPGTTVDIKSEFVEGTYRVITVEYNGSVWGQDFSITVEAKERQA